MAISKSLEMVDYLKNMSSKSTFDDLKQGLNGIFDSIANSLIVNIKILNLHFKTIKIKNKYLKILIGNYFTIKFKIIILKQ